MGNLPRTCRAALRRVPYLATLDDADFEQLAAESEVRALARDACAFTEGDPAAGIFVIVSGRIKVVRQGADGREQVLHEDGAGATLAEAPVFDGGGYVGTAIAVEACEVVMVPRRVLLDTLDRSPADMAAVSMCARK